MADPLEEQVQRTEAIRNRAVAELGTFPGVLAGLLADLPAEQWRRRPGPGRWAPVEIACHLRDEEREDFGARVRAVLDGGTRFAPIDPAVWVSERRYMEQDPRAALAEFAVLREESVRLLAAAREADLRRTIEHPGLGRMSGADLVAAWVVHDLLHLRQLAGTLARVQADDWGEFRCAYAGDLPYGEPKPQSS